MKKLSIMTKLLISYLLLAAGMAILTGIFILPSQLSSQRRQLEDTISQAALLLASNESLASEASAGTLSSYNIAMLDQISQASDKFDYVVLADQNGIRLYHPDHNLIGEPFSGRDEKDALSQPCSYITTRKGNTDIQKRAFHTICTKDGTICGFVMVSASLDTIRKEETQTILRLLAALFLILGTGLLFAYLISQNIRKSLLGFEPQIIAQMYLQRDEILDTLNEEILVIDAAGSILYHNETAGHSFPKDQIPSDFPLKDERKECMEQNINKRDLLAQYENRTLLVNMTPVPGYTQTQAVLMVIRDRTETTRLAEQLTGNSHVIEALRANTHEFMNKLHVILGLLQIGDIRQAMGFITNTADEIDTGYQMIVRQIQDPSVAALILGKQSHARELDIHFILRRDSFLPAVNPYLTTRELITVVGNLIENAFEAVNGTNTIRQTELFICCSRQGITISVDDTGCGMNEEQIQKIYSGQYTTKGEGHGIGLGLIQEIIRKHHGFLEIESEPGEGTSFTVCIGEAEGKNLENLSDKEGESNS